MKKNWLSMAAVCLSVAALTGCGKKDQQQQQQTPELAVMTVGEEDATLQTGYPATLRGTNDVEIRPQIQGFITQVCVQEGQNVSRGQVLFRIDQVQLQAAVDAAKAQVSQARAAVDVAQANVNTQNTNCSNSKLLLSLGQRTARVGPEEPLLLHRHRPHFRHRRHTRL